LQNDLLDSSGNGLTLTAIAGTARYTDIFPGVRCLFLDALTTFGRSAFTASLNILGDLTIECLLYVITNNVTTGVVSHGASGETEATNYSYATQFTTTTFQYLHEFSAGTNQTLVTTNLPPRRLSHLALVRASNVVQFYLNGRTFGAASGTLTAPTGSTSGRFRIGASEGLGTPGGTGVPNMISSVKVIASALTEAQIKAEYNLTLGSFFGFVN
jgi:hypothetical protein